MGQQRLRAEAEEVAARQRHQEQQIGDGEPALRVARTKKVQLSRYPEIRKSQRGYDKFLPKLQGESTNGGGGEAREGQRGDPLRQALPLPYHVGLQTRSDCCLLPELRKNKSDIPLTSTLIHKLSSSSAEACWMRQTEFRYRGCILNTGCLI